MKRILSLVLCLCVLIAPIPSALTAYAEDTEGMGDDEYSENIEDLSGVSEDDNVGEPGGDEDTAGEDTAGEDTAGEDIESQDIEGEDIEGEPGSAELPELSVSEEEDSMFTDLSFDDENSAQLEEARYVENELIVYFKDISEFPGKEKQYRDEVNKLTKVGFIEGLNGYIVRVDDLKQNPNAVLNRFKNSKFIESIELNYLADFDYIPNDSAYMSQQSAFLNLINAPAGWDIIKGGGPTIAVVDSGVVQHADLPPLLGGYSAVAGLSPTNDRTGHGTNVAGVIGAVGDNKIGIAGINWNAQIMPVKVDDASGTLTVANIAKGIIWAADNGASIINLSLGTTADSTTLKNAIDYAYNRGCAIFAATGNNSTSSIHYPARYTNVMAVGGTLTNGSARASSSNYGEGIDVVALGGYFSTSSSGSYALSSGTSFSSPQVAGLASLLYAIGETSPDAIYDLIRQGASGNGSFVNNEIGYGLINIGKALELAGGNAKTETEPAVLPNPTIVLTGFAEVSYFVGDTYKEDGYKATDYAGKDITSKVVITNNLNMKATGLYTVTYKVTDDYGGTASITRTVKVEPAPAAAPAQAPKITVIGSNPIILHSTSNTPYKEQSAKVIDYDGTDISNLVAISGTVNRAVPGTYTINYNVTSPKSGLSASTTRNVRIIAPTETITRMPYGFNGQAKQGAIITHTNIKADNFGWMDLKVGSLDKNMTITVEFIDTTTKKAAFKDTFSAAGTKQYKINEGKYELKVTVDKANGNSKYSIDLLMPEVLLVEFADAEVPLANIGSPRIAPIGSNPIILHLGGTPYTEQGARAIDYDNENISDRVEIIGAPDTSEAGTYYVTYRVVNDLGLDAEITREVRVIIPDEYGIFEDEEVPLSDLPAANGSGLQPMYVVLSALLIVAAGILIIRRRKKMQPK